jgi:hypothetical protein
VVDLLTFLFRIREVPDSYLVLETFHPDWGFSWFFSVPPGEWLGSTSESGQDCFLPNPFQFISYLWINYSLFYDAFWVTRLYSVDEGVTSEWWWSIGDDKHPCFKRDWNPRSQRPSDQNLRLRPRGHWDQHHSFICYWESAVKLKKRITRRRRQRKIRKSKNEKKERRI